MFPASAEKELTPPPSVAQDAWDAASCCAGDRALRASYVRGFGHVLTGNAVHALCQAGMLVVLAQCGGIDVVGRFACALAMVTPPIVASRLQLRGLLATDAANRCELGDFLGLTILASAAVLLLLAAAPAVGLGSWDYLLPVLLLGAAKSVESIQLVLHGLFQKHEQMQWISRSLLLKGPATLAALAVGTLATGTASGAIAGMLAAWLLILLLHDVPAAVGLLSSEPSRRLHRAETGVAAWAVGLAPKWRPRPLLLLAQMGVPLGLALLLSSLVMNVPRYFLVHYHGDRELGGFALVMSFMLVGSVLVDALMQPASPRFARYHARGERERFLRLLFGLMAVLSLASAAAILGAWAVGPLLLHLLFGAEAGALGEILVLVMAAGALFYLATPLGCALTAIRWLRCQPLVQVCVLSVTLAASYCLIPAYGVQGAAWTLFASGAVSLLGIGGLLIAWASRSSDRVEIVDIRRNASSSRRAAA